MIALVQHDEIRVPPLRRLRYKDADRLPSDGSAVSIHSIGWGVIILLAIVATIFAGPAIPIAASVLLLLLAVYIHQGFATTLPQKFASLGTIAGRTKDEIFKVTGLPSSMSTADCGKVHCHWETSRYRITLIFSGEICEGVAHEWQAIR